MNDRLPLTYRDVSARVVRLASDLDRLTDLTEVPGVYGVPRGGCVPAAILAGLLDKPMLGAPVAGCVVVDDLVDSGSTLAGVARQLNPDDLEAAIYAPLWRKSHSPRYELAEQVPQGDPWLVFPWEAGEEQGPTDAVVRILEHIGEDPNREGLRATPDRVVRAFSDMTSGYGADPALVLATVFEERCDEMVVVDGISFSSLCEHHLLPFTGTAVVGYVPDGKVVGLSKIPRLVEAYARRLQVQERMTTQIADSLNEVLAPKGVGVVVRAHHSCMGCRGVRQAGATMITSAMLGLFREDDRARAEFLQLAQVQRL